MGDANDLLQGWENDGRLFNEILGNVRGENPANKRLRGRPPKAAAPTNQVAEEEVIPKDTMTFYVQAATKEKPTSWLGKRFELPFKARKKGLLERLRDALDEDDLFKDKSDTDAIRFKASSISLNG